MPDRALVVVVDDDESVREALPELLRQCGYASSAFSSASEFLASDVIGRTACLILDIAMLGMSGIELYRELVRRGQAIPTVFITAHVDATDRARLLQEGAVECLFKPFSETDLLDAVTRALGATSHGVP